MRLLTNSNDARPNPPRLNLPKVRSKHADVHGTGPMERFAIVNIRPGAPPRRKRCAFSTV